MNFPLHKSSRDSDEEVPRSDSQIADIFINVLSAIRNDKQPEIGDLVLIDDDSTMWDRLGYLSRIEETYVVLWCVEGYMVEWRDATIQFALTIEPQGFPRP